MFAYSTATDHAITTQLSLTPLTMPLPSPPLPSTHAFQKSATDIYDMRSSHRKEQNPREVKFTSPDLLLPHRYLAEYDSAQAWISRVHHCCMKRLIPASFSEVPRSHRSYTMPQPTSCSNTTLPCYLHMKHIGKIGFDKVSQPQQGVVSHVKVPPPWCKA